MTSLRARFVRRVTSLYFKAKDPRTVNVTRMRRRWNALARRLPPAPGVRSSETTIAGRPALWLSPAAAPADRVLLYFHGGAYVMGSPTTHRQLVSHIAHAAGIRALLPDYRLAPEQPFPAALEDAVAAYRALLDEGLSPGSIAVGGDSAGGGLTMAMLLELREQGIPLPAFTVLLSPWLDLTGSGESMVTRAGADPWFRPGDMPVIAAFYCEPGKLTDPRVSPLFADLAGLPPALIQVGDDEILLSDATRLAERLSAAGGQAELEVWPGMWHVFQVFLRQVPEARDAVQRLGERLALALGGQASVA
ncbi:MAG: alpha/beta hydrolase [Woeseiaceae bacterium]|nr:alpha/beta hydrolase [Woeseiaceae bacterium]